MDPRQKRMWTAYVKPNSSTFGNAYASAKKAGYAELSSRRITSMGWFKSFKRRFNLLGKAEKVLEKTLDMDTLDAEGREQADLLRVQVDSAKFVAKTLGKDEGYSERNELTGRDGEGIVFMPVELLEKYNLSKKEEIEEV